MTTVLVTGYGGFLGQAIVRQLLANGYQVHGLARGTYPELQALGVHGFSGSITDRAAIEKAITGCDAVVHTAALAGVWGNIKPYYETNVRGTMLLVEAAVQARCQALVHTSSPSVTFDARPQSGIDETAPYPKRWLCHYPETKAQAEQLVLSRAQAGELWTASL